VSSPSVTDQQYPFEWWCPAARREFPRKLCAFRYRETIDFDCHREEGTSFLGRRVQRPSRRTVTSTIQIGAVFCDSSATQRMRQSPRGGDRPRGDTANWPSPMRKRAYVGC
jgi:hypothetical protein